MGVAGYRFFKRITGTKPPIKHKKACRDVDGQQGYKVVCGGVTCIMEFEAYEFRGAEGGEIGQVASTDQNASNSYPDNNVTYI